MTTIESVIEHYKTFNMLKEKHLKITERSYRYNLDGKPEFNVYFVDQIKFDEVQLWLRNNVEDYEIEEIFSYSNWGQDIYYQTVILVKTEEGAVLFREQWVDQNGLRF